MSVGWETQLRRDEEIVKATFRAMLLREGVVLGWLLLVVGILVSILLLR